MCEMSSLKPLDVAFPTCSLSLRAPCTWGGRGEGGNEALEVGGSSHVCNGCVISICTLGVCGSERWLHFFKGAQVEDKNCSERPFIILLMAAALSCDPLLYSQYYRLHNRVAL